MKIKKIGTNVKRHTKTLLCGGKWRSRSEVYKLALQGRVEGVIPCKMGKICYVRSLPKSNNRLTDLPTTVNA